MRASSRSGLSLRKLTAVEGVVTNFGLVKSASTTGAEDGVLASGQGLHNDLSIPPNLSLSGLVGSSSKNPYFLGERKARKKSLHSSSDGASDAGVSCPGLSGVCICRKGVVTPEEGSCDLLMGNNLDRFKSRGRCLVRLGSGVEERLAKFEPPPSGFEYVAGAEEGIFVIV